LIAESTVMNVITEHNRFQIGSLVVLLSLDATVPLQDYLGVPEIGGDMSVKEYCRNVMRHNTNASVAAEYADIVATLLPGNSDTGEDEFLEWLCNSYFGSHWASPVISSWMMNVLQLRNALRRQELALQHDQEIALKTFLDLVEDQIAKDEFEDKLDKIRERPGLSDWDMAVFKKFGFVYFDFNGGDPLMPLLFVNQGRGLKRAVALFDLDDHPAFPHEEMVAFGQKFIEENQIPMPGNMRFPSLRELL
jgi:hypothetical protein